MGDAAGRFAVTAGMALVGGYFFGPWGMYLGTALGSMAGNYLFPVEYPDVRNEGPRVTDLKVQSSAYGCTIPMAWGLVRLPGNIIWALEIEEVVHKEKIETDTGCGGGGGGGSVTNITYSYYGTFASAFCKGPIEKFLRIWADAKLIYDVTDTAGAGDPIQMDGMTSNHHLGTATQEVDPIIELYEGEGEVTAHRDIAYIVFHKMPLANFGNRIPNINAELCTTVTESMPAIPINSMGTSVWGMDSMVKTVDEYWMVVQDQTSNYQWNKYNALSPDATFSRLYDDEDIPALQGVFTVDELGYVYTTQERPGSEARAVVLEPNGFNIARYGDDIYLLLDMFVVRNPVHPWLYGRCSPNGYIECFHRGTESEDPMNPFDFVSAAYEITPTMVGATGCIAKFVAPDHRNGDAYVTYSPYGCGSASGYLLKINSGTVGPMGEIDGFGVDTVVDISSYINCPEAVAFDPRSNTVIVGSLHATQNGNPGSWTNDSVLAFFDGTTLAYVGRIDQNIVPAYWRSMFLSEVVNGIFWGRYDTDLYKIDVASQSIIATYDLTDARRTDTGAQPNLAGGGFAYDPVTHSIWASAHTGEAYPIYKVLLDRADPNSVTLSDLVTDICEEVGMSASDIDVTELTDSVNGFFIDRKITGRGAILSLMSGYFFDAVESDGKIKFLKRGRTPTVTIGEGELAAKGSSSQAAQRLMITRQQEAELPVSLDVRYTDMDRDHQVGTQRARRLITSSKHAPAIDVPVLLDADEAAQIADIQLKMAWLYRTKFKFQLPLKYLYLDATDVIKIKYKDETYKVRLTGVKFPGTHLDVEGVEEDSSVYSSNVVGESGDFVAPSILYIGPSLCFVCDVPMFRDADNVAGLYVAACGYTDAWTGAVIYKSNDDGASYIEWAAMMRESIAGRAITALADFDHDYWDNGNTVDIRLARDDMTLSNATETEVLNGENWMLLGDEIIGFTTATLDSDGYYTLSGLVRGLRGTDWAKSTHTPGDRAILLEESGLNFVQIQLDELDHDRAFKAVSLGQPQSSAIIVDSFNVDIATLMPYSVVHEEVTRDGSQNIAFTWIRRTRVGGAWADGFEVPLGEATEEYEIDIIDRGDRTTVLRTIEVTEEAADYLETEQDSDGPHMIYGYEELMGGSTQNFPVNNYKYVTQFVFAVDAYQISAIWVYFNAYKLGSPKVKAICYSDSSDTPNALLYTGSEVVDPGDTLEGWVSLPFATPFDLTAGAYWFGLIGEGYKQVECENTGIIYYNADTYSDGASDPFGAASSVARTPPIRIYADNASIVLANIYQISASVGRGYPRQIEA